jgi:hypothetical protein
VAWADAELPLISVRAERKATRDELRGREFSGDFDRIPA